MTPRLRDALGPFLEKAKKHSSFCHEADCPGNFDGIKCAQWKELLAAVEADEKSPNEFLSNLKAKRQNKKEVVTASHELMKKMSCEERVVFISEITVDYCVHCGTEEFGRSCQCQNDE